MNSKDPIIKRWKLLTEFSITDLAEHAGISRQHVYNLFGDKRAVSKTALICWMNSLADIKIDAVERQLTELKGLKDLITQRIMEDT